MTSSAGRLRISLSIGDVLKRIFLGKPLISEHLESESLSNTVALGALSPDAISSTVYGPEQIMVELLPAAGLAAYVLVLPIAGVILLILALVTGSYRQVVMAYTQRGGSYVVARANFGPRWAQLSAAALLIDYVVTVAVQCASGTFAVVSAVPSLGTYHLEITVGALLLISYANLRGMKEAGRIFAVPVYAFIVMLTVLIVTGVVRRNLLGFTAIRSDADRRSGAGPSGERAGDGRHGAGVAARIRQRWHVADRGRVDRRRGQHLS